MAKVIVTLKIMPVSPETDLKAVEEKATKLISDFSGEVGKVEVQPVAFGLKALLLYFIMEEETGSTELLEKNVSEVEGVNSVEIIDVRRAIG